jgi:hypothetical protein
MSESLPVKPLLSESLSLRLADSGSDSDCLPLAVKPGGQIQQCWVAERPPLPPLALRRSPSLRRSLRFERAAVADA